MFVIKDGEMTDEKAFIMTESLKLFLLTSFSFKSSALHQQKMLRHPILQISNLKENLPRLSPKFNLYLVLTPVDLRFRFAMAQNVI